MAVVRKYEFDREFDRPRGKPAPAPELAAVAEPEKPPEPVFSAEEVTAARQTGWSEGHAAGMAAAQEAIEKRLASATESLAAAITALAADNARLHQRLERQSAGILLDLVRKLGPALLDRIGTGAIEALVDEVFSRTLDQPRLMVRCAPPLVDAVEALARDAAARVGFDGRLGVLADPRLCGDECRIEWADGGAEQSGARMIETIEAAVLRSIAAFDRGLGDPAPAAMPTQEAAA